MRVLVVGAGFLGSAIANRMAHSGHAVTVLSPKPGTELDLEQPELTFCHGRLEVGTDLDDLLAHTQVVVDAASSYVPATVQASPAAATATAVGSSVWLAERAVSFGVGCHVYISSGGTVYGAGSTAKGHRETDRTGPISAYGAMKLAAETCISAVAHGTSTRTVALRVSNAYGPGQNLARPQGIIGVAFRNHLLGEATTLYGAAQTIRDFIYVDDVAMLCEAAVRSTHAGPLNAALGTGISLDDLLAAIEGVLQEPLRLVHVAERPFDVRRSVLDNTLARSLGWAPRTSLSEGLSATWEWIKHEIAEASS